MPRQPLRALRPHGRQWAWALSAAGLILNGLRYRQRLEALAVVEPLDGPGPAPGGPAAVNGHAPAGNGHAGPAGAGAATGSGRFRLVTARGVEVPPGALAAAVAHAEREGLDVLDLVPEDLDAERALELARMVDPAAFRADPLAVGRSAHHAVLIDAALADRLDVAVPEGPVEDADLAELIVDAKHHAPETTDMALLVGLRAVPEEPARRRDLLRVLNGDENASGAALFGLGVLGAGLAAAPGWGALALLAYGAQPALSVGETPLKAGLPPGDLLARPLRSAARAVRTARDSTPTRRSEEMRRSLEQARDDYRRLLASGTGRFFAPRRDFCPWCGHRDLEPRVDAIDLAQNKPGRFHVDRCRNCSHVFSNPPLSPEGFDFYYRDFYSGLFEHALTKKFQVDEPLYKLRADIVRRHYDRGEPELWLDVGTGHGHFPLSARKVFPNTAFEALDMGEAVVTAERRGWVDKAHYGRLPDLAEGLAERYDVVSMHHCLEHTADPRDQLVHLKRVLRPGGFLSIEVPDPECWGGEYLRQWWGPYFQPQHQNMVPIGNLAAALRAEGFTVVATERQEAHEQFELTMAAFLRLNKIGPPPGLPWRETRPGDTARRVATFTLGAPLIAAAVVGDKLVDQVVRRLPHGPNAYRVLARLDGEGTGGPEGHPGVRGLAHDPSLAQQPAPARPAPVTVGAAAPGGPVASSVPVASLEGAPAWSGALLDALAPEVGTRPAYAAAPRDLEPDPLPGTYGFRLHPGGDGAPAVPGPGQGGLMVRVAEARADLDREAAALRAAASAGVAVPAPRCLAALDGAPAGSPGWALVTDRPEGRPMLELVGPHLNYFDAVLAGFAQYHAGLHNRTEGAAAGVALPTIDPEAEIARIDADRYPAQVAWLRQRLAAPGPAVLCHGGFEPRCVSGPGPDEWDTHGGPGQGLVGAHWGNAVLAEREFDVGVTLMAFWVAPMFVDHRALRAQFKMIRNKLASRYLRSYADHGHMDQGRAAFWQGFHALRVVAQVDGAYDQQGSPFPPPDVASLPKGLGKELTRLFRIVSARERRGELTEAG